TPPPPGFYPLSLHDALPIFRGLKAAIRIALEVQHLRRQQPPLRQRRRYLFWHRAKILADDERVVPDAFQRENAEQIVRPVSNERSEEHTSELQSLRHLVCRL